MVSTQNWSEIQTGSLLATVHKNYKRTLYTLRAFDEEMQETQKLKRNETRQNEVKNADVLDGTMGWFWVFFVCFFLCANEQFEDDVGGRFRVVCTLVWIYYH